MGYAWCKHCAANRCTWWRHWHVVCRLCKRVRIFRGPSCRACHADAKALVADLFG